MATENHMMSGTEIVAFRLGPQSTTLHNIPIYL
jgi:hypothetical protein